MNKIYLIKFELKSFKKELEIHSLHLEMFKWVKKAGGYAIHSEINNFGFILKGDNNKYNKLLEKLQKFLLEKDVVFNMSFEVYCGNLEGYWSSKEYLAGDYHE